MATCSLFNDFATPAEKKSLILIGKDIQSGKYKTEVEQIRKLLSSGDKEKADALKKKLPAFTPSGIFIERRLSEKLEMYSGFVHLDFDKIPDDQFTEVQKLIEEIPFTNMCFISPSGDGLKVFIEVNTGHENHENTYNQVRLFYEEKLGIKADEKCKDITRLCFMSYDENIFTNINSKKFIIDLPGNPQGLLSKTIKFENKPKELAEPVNLNSAFLFNQQLEFTNKKSSFHEGNRNNYIFTLACNCNRVGISQDDLLMFCKHQFDFSESEIRTTINSAYNKNRHQHNTIQLSQSNSDNIEEQETTETVLPCFPDDIFIDLPPFFQRITSVATTNEERDILLLASLVTLSVAFPKVLGLYGDNIVTANLYTFISAKASAGKGILNHCRKLVEPIHHNLRMEAKALKQQYELDLSDFNAIKGKEDKPEKPQKPPQRMLFIPANNSATGFLELLGDSDERGLIFETEGDTLSKAFKSDYGDFSDGFRNAFQHEPISYYRRTDKEYVEIKRPCLSVMLSGTPKQIQALIPNTENGLFSRFMFYVMNMNLAWKDVFASKTESGLEKHFTDLGKEFFTLYQTLQINKEIHFSLSLSQETTFNNFFAQKQNLYITIQDEDIVSSVRRLGLTAYRIMMVLSSIRIMDDGDISPKLVCSDTDFNTVLKMIDVLLKHSSHVFTQIASLPYISKPKHKKEQFLEKLPHTFNRQNYVSLAISLGITDKSSQRFIRDFVNNGIIEKPSHDSYINPNASNPK